MNLLLAWTEPTGKYFLDMILGHTDTEVDFISNPINENHLSMFEKHRKSSPKLRGAKIVMEDFSTPGSNNASNSRNDQPRVTGLKTPPTS
jgi:hypothetical protein